MGDLGASLMRGDWRVWWIKLA